jgi:thiol-disulfide isomerase/thioredoxin
VTTLHNRKIMEAPSVSSTEQPDSAGPEARRDGRRIGLGRPIWAALALGMQASVRPSHGGLEGYARASLVKLQVSPERPAAPANTFQNPAGAPTRIADLPGQVKVVNLWATNCAPCKLEMPTLAALAQAYPGRVSVTPISLDPVGRTEQARAFIAAHAPLPFHQDPSFAIAFAMEAQGMPTTVIYDAGGRERARLSGAAEWNSPEARALIDALLAGA